MKTKRMKFKVTIEVETTSSEETIRNSISFCIGNIIGNTTTLKIVRL